MNNSKPVNKNEPVKRYIPPSERTNENKSSTFNQTVNSQIAQSEQITEVEAKKPRNAATQVNDSPVRKMTGKEKLYVKELVTNPRTTKRDAIRKVYDVKEGVSNKTLDNMAGRIEKRKPVLMALTAYSERSEELLKQLAEQSVTYAMSGTKEGAMYASTAERTLNSVLDRVHGKAKQSMDIRQEVVQLNVDLSS